MMPDYVTWSPPAMPEVPCATAMATAVGAPGSPRRIDGYSSSHYTDTSCLSCLSFIPSHIDACGMPSDVVLPNLVRIPRAADWHFTLEGWIRRSAIDAGIASIAPNLDTVNGMFHRMLRLGIPRAEAPVRHARKRLYRSLGGDDALSNVIRKVTESCPDSLIMPRAMVDRQMEFISGAGSHCMDLARTLAEETLAFNTAQSLWLLCVPFLGRGMTLAELIWWVKNASLIRRSGARFCFTSFSTWLGLKTYAHREIMALVRPAAINPLVFPVFYSFLDVQPFGAFEMIDSPKWVGLVHEFEGRSVDYALLNTKMVDVVVRRVLSPSNAANLDKITSFLGTVRQG